MRALLALSIIVFGVVGACAADRDVGGGYSGVDYFSSGQRAGQFVTYDFQPGVVVRTYWLTPWRHRHYFPRTGKMPRLGRYENLSAVSVMSKPPQTFRRSWSTSSIVLSDAPPPRPRLQDAPSYPRDEQFNAPPLRGK